MTCTDGILGTHSAEILAGVLVAIRPAIGGYVVAAWLLGIIVKLVTMGEYLDFALRDFGLLVGALALARFTDQVGGTRSIAPRCG